MRQIAVQDSEIIKEIKLEKYEKDFYNFNFRMNDPPPLVKEQSFYLLNRATHVLIPEDENGDQFELTYTLPNKVVFTVNYTRAKNRISSIRSWTFQSARALGVSPYKLAKWYKFK